MSRLRTAKYQRAQNDELSITGNESDEINTRHEIADWSDMADEHVFRSQLRKKVFNAIHHERQTLDTAEQIAAFEKMAEGQPNFIVLTRWDAMEQLRASGRASASTRLKSGCASHSAAAL